MNVCWKVLRVRGGVIALFPEDFSLKEGSVAIDSDELGVHLQIDEEIRMYLTESLIVYLQDNPKIHLAYNPVEAYDFTVWKGTVELDKNALEKIFVAISVASELKGKDDNEGENDSLTNKGKEQ